MFAALPGALVAAPFSLILLGALTTQIGTLQIAPVAIAVLTAYLADLGHRHAHGPGEARPQARRCRREHGDRVRPTRLTLTTPISNSPQTTHELRP